MKTLFDINIPAMVVQYPNLACRKVLPVSQLVQVTRCLKNFQNFQNFPNFVLLNCLHHHHQQAQE